MKKTRLTNIPRILARSADQLRNGDIGIAEQALKSVVLDAPGNLAARHMLSLICLNRGEFGEAERHASAGLGIDRRNTQLLMILSETQRQSGRLELAADTLRRLLAHEPGHAEALNNLGGILVELGQHDEAVVTLDRLLSSGRGGPTAENNIGTALFNTGRREEALTHYRKALAARPANFEALFNIANTFAETGRADEARAAYEACIGCFPDRPEPLHRLGDMHYRNGRVGEAIAAYDRALQLSPEGPDILLSMGRAQHDLGHTKLALDCFKRALNGAPDRPEIMIPLSGALIDLGLHDEARHHARGASKLLAAPSYLYCELASVFVALEETAEAGNLLKRYIEFQPDMAGKASLLLAGITGNTSLSEFLCVRHNMLPKEHVCQARRARRSQRLRCRPFRKTSLTSLSAAR